MPDETPVLLAARMHPKTLQHFNRGPESDGLALLLRRQSRQEDRNQSVLPERHAELWMAGDLEHELSVPPLVQELIDSSAGAEQVRAFGAFA
jgi:hypothetical protein